MSVTGIRFREWSTEDLARMVEVVNRGLRVDRVGVLADLESMRAAYNHLERCDPERDIVVAEVADENRSLIGFARTTWFDDVDAGRCYYNVGAVDPGWQERGIGTALFDWVTDRIRAIAAEHPAGTKWIQSHAFESQIARVALLEAQGLERVMREVEMVRPTLEDIADAPLPAGFVVRTPTDGELRAVWDADVEAFRDHWGSTESTEADYSAFLRHPWHDPTLWRVAWDGDRVAGQVLSFINTAENAGLDRKRGYTESISVRRPYRGRGLARALLTLSLHAIRERGMTEAGLGVHVENPHGALRLYESVGFEPVATRCIWRKRLDMAHQRR